MALHAGIEREPGNVRLRSLAVEFLGRHTKLLLGGGKSLLPGAWIGWRGGFIDEIRTQPFARLRTPVTALADLLAHPSCRFVRCVGFGALPKVQDAIDVLVDAAPPLLTAVVVFDSDDHRSSAVAIDRLAELPTLRRLGANSTTIEIPMPQLVELSCHLGRGCEDWVATGGCPNVEIVTIDCRASGERVARLSKMLAGLPKLRRLRLLHLENADEVVDLLARFEGQLESLDLSHSSVTAEGARRLRGRGMELVALRTALAGIDDLAVGSVTASPRDSADSIGDDEGVTGGWLHHVMSTEGRDGLMLMPGIGRMLFRVGTHHSTHGNPELATTLLDTSLTLPNAALQTKPWANAAIAHSRLNHFDEAELISREGLLRTPNEPNLYANVVDVLRRTDRLAAALALLPSALAAITATPGAAAHAGGPAACLADCLLVLAQAGRHIEVLELADEHAKLIDAWPHIHAIVAMSQLARGDTALAKASMSKAKPKHAPSLISHAKAAMYLAAPRADPARALAALEQAKRADYPEWHWIATDPNLSRLHGNPAFEALIAT